MSRESTLPISIRSTSHVFHLYSFEGKRVKTNGWLSSPFTYIIPKLPAFVKFFSALHLPLSTQSNAEYCDSNSVIGKGIEPHPTDGSNSRSFLTTLRLMLRTLSRHLSCRVDQVGSQLLSQPNITIISKLQPFVKFFLIFFCFFWSAHPPLPVRFPERTYSLRPTYFI